MLFLKKGIWGKASSLSSQNEFIHLQLATIVYQLQAKGTPPMIKIYPNVTRVISVNEKSL